MERLPTKANAREEDLYDGSMVLRYPASGGNINEPKLLAKAIIANAVPKIRSATTIGTEAKMTDCVRAKDNPNVMNHNPGDDVPMTPIKM